MPAKKKNTARGLGSKKWRKMYAEMIAIMGQTTGMGATVPPWRRIPSPGAPIMTLWGEMGNTKTTAKNKKSAINLR
jgi:hypothetical protein